MSQAFTESVIKQAALAWLEIAAWAVKNGVGMVSAKPRAERIIGRAC